MKHFEFWHPRLFELPYYGYLAYLCLRHRISIRSLAKANYALDHGEIGIGSKYLTQTAFDQTLFPASLWLPDTMDRQGRRDKAQAFVSAEGLPVILKPDAGCVGKGIQKIHSVEELMVAIDRGVGDLILQQYCDHPLEFGVFFVRHSDRARVTGINRKHFPCVTGDGHATIAELAQRHPRYSRHWRLFLQYHDTGRVPDAGEALQLSFIGSHTMGCKFTDESRLLTVRLEQAIIEYMEKQPGFNFGRLDIKCASIDALQRGEFVIIEINGVASLPTHMFDPGHRLRDAYRIFLSHARHLVKAAGEHRAQSMPLLSYAEILTRVRQKQSELNVQHEQVLGK